MAHQQLRRVRARCNTISTFAPPKLVAAGESDDEDFPHEIETPQIEAGPFMFTKPAMVAGSTEHLEQLVSRYEGEAKALESTAQHSWRQYKRTKDEVERFETMSEALRQLLETCEDCNWTIRNLDNAVDHLRSEVRAEAEYMHQTVGTLQTRIPEARKILADMHHKRRQVDELVRSAEEEVANMLRQIGAPEL